MVLADLSLILFLTTASALSDEHERRDEDVAMRPEEAGDVGAATALYMMSADGPAFDDWLTSHPRDPREQLTIRANFNEQNRAEITGRVERLAQEAMRAGFTPRIIFEPIPGSPGVPESPASSRITASFAFNAGPALASNVAQLLQGAGADTSALGD